jgi:hypothetical protein
VSHRSLRALPECALEERALSAFSTTSDTQPFFSSAGPLLSQRTEGHGGTSSARRCLLSTHRALPGMRKAPAQRSVARGLSHLAEPCGSPDTGGPARAVRAHPRGRRPRTRAMSSLGHTAVTAVPRGPRGAQVLSQPLPVLRRANTDWPLRWQRIRRGVSASTPERLRAWLMGPVHHQGNSVKHPGLGPSPRARGARN